MKGKGPWPFPALALFCALLLPQIGLPEKTDKAVRVWISFSTIMTAGVAIAYGYSWRKDEE